MGQPDKDKYDNYMDKDMVEKHIFEVRVYENGAVLASSPTNMEILAQGKSVPDALKKMGTMYEAMVDFKKLEADLDKTVEQVMVMFPKLSPTELVVKIDQKFKLKASATMIVNAIEKRSTKLN